MPEIVSGLEVPEIDFLPFRKVFPLNYFGPGFEVGLTLAPGTANTNKLHSGVRVPGYPGTRVSGRGVPGTR
eukprot:2970241-Rhodomonas_salina.1